MKPTNKNNSNNDSRPSSFFSRLIYNPKFRSYVFQILTLVVLGYIISIFVNNAIDSLTSKNIQTGFGFLDRRAGFDISQTLIEYTEDSTFGRVFWVGITNTALVSILGIILATVLGFIVGIARLSSNWVVRKVATAYIEIVRNVPPLIQILFWYFAVLQPLPSPKQSLGFADTLFLNNRGLYLPKAILESGSGMIFIAFILAIVLSVATYIWGRNRQRLTGQTLASGWISIGLLIGLPLVAYFLAGQPISLEYPELRGFNFVGGTNILPELFALLLALGIFTSGFIAEIVRSGVEAVSHGQTEAAMALGLPKTKTLKLVVIPQALRIIIPPLTSEYLNLTKNSSLATVIGYPELVSVFAGTTLNQTGNTIEIISMTMLVYLALSLFTSFVMNIYNNKVALVER